MQVANFVWLIGTWGANYTLLDLMVVNALVTMRPNKASILMKPIKALKRCMLILLVGMVASAMAFVHFAVNKKVSGYYCDDTLQTICMKLPLSHRPLTSR